MKNRKRLRSAIRQNYLQLLFVFLTFTVMGLAAYFSIGSILRGRLLRGAHELLYSAEANAKAGLSEGETTLINSYYIVKGMLERGDSQEEILEYLVLTSEWMRRPDGSLLDFYGIYGFINGEFFNGTGMIYDSDYIPQKRPWYIAAMQNENAAAYTAPYIDWDTGDTIISAARTIDIHDGWTAGVLGIDINIKWLIDYVASLALTDDGYGILVSQDMTVMAHPDVKYLGSQLYDLGGAYNEIAGMLFSGYDVFARRIKDSSGGLAIVFFKRIFNGWYVGIVTPYSQFYRDLHYSAFILIVLGLGLSLSLCFLLIRLYIARMRADEESKAKSSFLASMSHEIRTPMNAITGMAELILRGDISGETRGHAQDIKQASKNLISIINDILDFSKIEAGKLDINPARYFLSSLVNDTVNIINMRIKEKPIQFTTNIDAAIPNSLIGDEVRLRQILINLLSNAAKYTDEGHINLSITSEKQLDNNIWINFSVTDTGRGIKPEDQKALFKDFAQVDTDNNRGIEGIGLGLAITRRLCAAMGGSISMESEYGKGSRFTVIVPQVVSSSGLPGDAENADKKNVPVYEKYNFSSAKLLVVDDIDTNLKVAEGLLAPYNLAVDICQSGTEAVKLIKSRNYDLVFMDHMMPGMDGIEATAVIRKWEVDHDGVQVPIIALTANAISGMREMFIDKGFNDFLAKPIDVSKLDEIISQWIPKNKWEKINGKSNAAVEQSESITISGVDVDYGIRMTGGKMSNYLQVLKAFSKDVYERIPLFQAAMDTAAHTHNAGSLKTFVTHVHAIKSAAASIGAKEVSANAAELEAAGAAGDTAFIQNKLQDFSARLYELAKQIDKCLEDAAHNGSEGMDAFALPVTLLRELETALRIKNAEDIDRIMEELTKEMESCPGGSIKTTVDQISEDILMAEYEKALNGVSEVLKT